MDENQKACILRAFLSAGDGAVKLDKADSAEHFYEEALRFAEKHLGKEAPETGLVNYSLSMFYLGQGQHSQAAHFANAALDIFTNVFGCNHPTTGIALHHLAEVCMAQNLHAVANPIRRRATEIIEEHLETLDFSVPATSDSTLNVNGRMKGLMKGMMSIDDRWSQKVKEVITSDN